MFNTIDSNEPYFKLIESDKIISIDTNLYNIDKLEGENPAVDIKDLKYLNNDRKIIFMIGDASYPYVYYDSDDDTWRLRTSMSGLSNPMGLDMIVRFSYNNMNIESFGCDVPQTTSGDYVVSCNIWHQPGHEPNGDYVVSCDEWGG